MNWNYTVTTTYSYYLKRKSTNNKTKKRHLRYHTIKSVKLVKSVLEGWT